MKATRIILILGTFWSACSSDESTKDPFTAKEESAPQKKEESSSKPEETGPIDPATVGTIKGNVFFDGSAPEPKEIKMSSNADCKGLHSTPVFEETLLVKNGKLKNVFVYVLSGLGKRKFDPPANPILIDQVGCTYKPHVVGIQTGQELKIANSDPLTHNVHADSDKGQGYNELMNKGAAPMATKFTRQEIIYMRCDVHGWMKSYIGVFSHPFFTVTDDNGSFEIKGLPPGDYTIRAWHEAFEKPQDLKVSLASKETKEIQFRFKK